MTGGVEKGKSLALEVAPLFVLDVPEQLVTRAKANREKPFPWGNDYSRAREVSVVYGETAVEKGLRARSER